MSAFDKQGLRTFKIRHWKGALKTFTHCLDALEAKQRFQWTYGYWPDENDVSEVTALAGAN